MRGNVVWATPQWGVAFTAEPGKQQRHVNRGERPEFLTLGDLLRITLLTAMYMRPNCLWTSLPHYYVTLASNYELTTRTYLGSEGNKVLYVDLRLSSYRTPG